MLKMPKLLTRTLSLQLSVMIVSAIALLLLASLGVMLYFSRQALKQEALQNAEQTLEGTVQHIDNILLSVEQATGNIYFSIINHLQDPQSLDAYCKRLVESNPYIASCTITKSTSNENESPLWTDPKLDNNTGEKNVTTFRLPIYDAQGQQVAVMTADVAISLLSQIVLTAKPTENGYCTLLGSDGSFIVHPDTNKLLHQTVFTQVERGADTSVKKAAEAMVRGEKGYKEFLMNGQNCFVFYKPFERSVVPGRAMVKLGWSVGVVFPEDDIRGDYNRLLYYVYAIAIAGLILLFLLCGMITHRQLLPLRMLTHFAQRIAEGNYDETIPDTHRHDEIGLLQDNFRQMQQSLATNVSELEQLKTTLNERGELLRKAYRKAKEANRMKMAFLHNMTNQMLDPTMVVSQKVSILCDYWKELSQQESNKISEDIQQKAAIITELLKHMLDDSEAEAGKEVEHE